MYEATNSGGEISPLLNTNALSVFIPLYPGSNSPITYFFKVNVVDNCGVSDTNQVELSTQPLLDPTKSQVGDGIPNSWKQHTASIPSIPQLPQRTPMATACPIFRNSSSEPIHWTALLRSMLQGSRWRARMY